MIEVQSVNKAFSKFRAADMKAQEALKIKSMCNFWLLQNILLQRDLLHAVRLDQKTMKNTRISKEIDWMLIQKTITIILLHFSNDEFWYYGDYETGIFPIIVKAVMHLVQKDW